MTTTPPTINPTCPPKHLGGGGPVRRSGAKEEQPPTINQQPPTLKGWVTTQHQFYNGKKLGPYYFRRWKENGKLHKQYIKPSEVEKVRAQCAAHRAERNYQQSLNKDFRLFRGNWTFYTRIVERCHKRPVTPEQSEFTKRIVDKGFFIPGRPSLRRKLPPRAFRAPRVTKRKWKEIQAAFMYAFNDAYARNHPEQTFDLHAADLKKHILATVRPKKRRLALLGA